MPKSNRGSRSLLGGRMIQKQKQYSSQSQCELAKSFSCGVHAIIFRERDKSEIDNLHEVMMGSRIYLDKSM